MEALQLLLMNILKFYNIDVSERDGRYVIVLRDKNVDLFIIYGKNVEMFKEIIEVLDEYVRGKEQNNAEDKA